MLSDEQLYNLYKDEFNKALIDENTFDDPQLVALRAVAEAAVKDATSDWCVSDSVMAGRIMNVFGRSHDPSLEPAADPFRDKIAAMIYQHRTAVKNAVRYTSDGALAECPCCGSLDVGGAHDTVHCYKCGLSMKRPPPLQNAADAWNRRTRPQASAAVLVNIRDAALRLKQHGIFGAADAQLVLIEWALAASQPEVRNV